MARFTPISAPRRICCGKFFATPASATRCGRRSRRAGPDWRARSAATCLPAIATTPAEAVRDAFTDKIAGIIELIAAHLDSGTQRERRRKAVAVYGLMVGTLQLARAVNDKRLSEEILQSGAEQALALASQRGK